MFKTVFRVTTALGVLLAAYAGYTRVFALVAAGLRTARDPGAYSHTTQESATQRMAINLAIQAFGRPHWAAEEKLPIRIYNAERGFWIYARDYERLNEGKTIVFTPFALIWRSRDGRSLKTVTSHSATIDLDESFSLVTKPGSSGGSMKVVHARVEGDVLLRDDKATDDTGDDMKISGLTYIDYNEKTLQVVGDDNDTVVIEDSAYRVLGKGLLIKLRPKEEGVASGSSSGFNGAQTAILKRDVFITLYDVGPGGMLPGNAGVKRRKGGTPTPLTARCDGNFQVDLPKPRIPARVGPPAPPDPTFAEFHRNVEVIRGKTGLPQDQLDSDVLRLTLVPPPKDDSAKADASGSEDEVLLEHDHDGESSEGGLTLKRAEATGHNVRLELTAQGIKAHGKEMIHKKRMPDAPDETYLRGDATTKLEVKKTDIAQDGPDKGKITGFSIIRTIDATIFDDGLGSDHATIVARGPGDLETRPGLNAPVERTAHWLDQLTLQSEYVRDITGTSVVSGKRLTLTGSPGFNDIPAAAKLKARDLIVVFLKPNGKAVARAADPLVDQDKNKDPAAARTTYEIERLFARQDVRLDAPNRTLVAREWLDAQFETRASNPPTVSAVAASSPAESDPNANAPQANPKPLNPLAKATANRVSAKILLRPGTGANRVPGGSSKSTPTTGASLLGDGPNQGTEVQSVLLRGAVTFHQDPAPGKTRGTDAIGEAVDIYNRGPDVAKFVIFHRLPPIHPAAEDLDADLAPLARIDFDDMTFRGQVIGLDQATNEAWIDGRGSLTKLAAVGLLSDQGLPGQTPPAAKPGAPRNLKTIADAAPPPPETTNSTPMTIAFDGHMKFFGSSTNMKGQPAARAEFFKNVHAETNESILDCKDVMRVYFDRTVKLARATNPNTPGGVAEPKAEIATIECLEDVVVINEKLDPPSKQLLQKQRIEGDHLIYEKLTGNFQMKSPGIVYLYEREGQAGQSMSLPSGAVPRQVAPAVGGANGRVIRPTSGPQQNREAKAPVIGHNGVRNPAELKAPARQGIAPLQAVAPVRALPPLVLTQVRFSREMAGGSAPESDRQGQDPLG